MGHKSSPKRAAAAAKKAASTINEVRQEQSKTEPVLDDSTSSAATSEDRQKQSKTEPHASTSSSASIMTECKPAFDAIKHGDTAKALRILKDACLRYESSAGLAHHIQSSEYFAIATKTLYLEHVQKQLQLAHAIESSDRAVLLSPTSFHFAFHYARVLYEAQAYEKAEQECKRALSIDNPIDPAKDIIPGEERLYKDHATAEERIAYVKNELQELLEKSKTASARRKEERLALARKKKKDQRKLKEKMEEDGELGPRTEFEEEEGKLKDTFEYQRQVGSEVQQKQLAEPNENTSAGSPSQRALEDSVMQSDKQIDLQDKPQAQEEIQERMDRKKELYKEIPKRMDRKKGLYKEITKRMDRKKELYKEIQESIDRKKELYKEIQELNKRLNLLLMQQWRCHFV